MSKTLKQVDSALATLRAAYDERNKLAAGAGASEEKINAFNAKVQSLPAKDRGAFIAQSLDITKEHQEKASNQMVATSMGAPITVTPIRGGKLRSFLVSKTLAPDETAQIDTDSNSYGAYWVGPGGDIRRSQADFARADIDIFELATDLIGIRDTEVSRNPWAARAWVQDMVSEQLEKEEDKYFYSLVRTAVAATNGTSDDHYRSRSSNSISQAEALALVKILYPHAGGRGPAAMSMGTSPLFDMFAWGTADSYSTLFTPNTREQIINTLSIGTFAGANVYYDEYLDSEASSVSQYYVYAFLEASRLGYIVTRPIDGLTRKTSIDEDIVTSEYLFVQRETIGISIANTYGAAISLQ